MRTLHIAINGTFQTATASAPKADQICLGPVCITGRLRRFRGAATPASVISPTTEIRHLPVTTTPGSLTNSESPDNANWTAENDTQPDTEAPTITINGNNPATIPVGTPYADLGATVTDNVDQNVGLRLFLDGSPTAAISIDTSIPATHSIDYVATDTNGNTATSTRTVIVSAPANDNPPPPEAASTSQASGF